MSGHPKLYYSEIVSDCIEVLTLLFENDIKFERHRLEIIDKDETKESWFRDLSTEGKLPVLKGDDDILEVGKIDIIKWIKKQSGKNEEEETSHPVCELIKDKAYIASLTCAMISGLLDDTIENTQTIHWPFHQKDQKLKVINAIQSIQREEYDENMTVDGLMSNTTLILDELENCLSKEDRIGVWLLGPQFSDKDCLVITYLMRIYQIGLDQLWTDGERPHIALYVQQAFQRPSVVMATGFKEHENEFYIIDKESEEIKHARYACYSGIILTGAYLLFRAFKK